MDIKDLAGLGEPLKKLIEVVSVGFGKMYEPSAIKKNAEAKAIEIRTITSALSESNLIVEKVSYEEGKLVINTVSDNSSISERAIDRLISQEIKRQANIENIINNAANELKETKVVSNERIDEDWISRFFSIADDVTSEEMQFIWGKILASEIKKPKSFSLRTLEFVKNLSKDDAELIARFCKLGFLAEKDVFIIGDINLLKKRGIDDNDIFMLKELNIAQFESLSIFTRFAVNVNDYSNFVCGNNVLQVENMDKEKEIGITIIPFTIIGAELYRLIEKEEDMEYFKETAKFIRGEHNNVKVFLKDLSINHTNNNYDKTKIQEL